MTWCVDGLDRAIVGLVDGEPHRVAYDEEKAILVYMESNEVDRMEAIEWLEYNVFNTTLGPGSPIWINPMNREQIDLFVDSFK